MAWNLKLVLVEAIILAHLVRSVSVSIYTNMIDRVVKSIFVK